MVKSTSGKKQGLRSFKVIDVRKHSGCEQNSRVEDSSAEHHWCCQK